MIYICYMYILKYLYPPIDWYYVLNRGQRNLFATNAPGKYKDRVCCTVQVLSTCSVYFFSKYNYKSIYNSILVARTDSNFMPEAFFIPAFLFILHSEIIKTKPMRNYFHHESALWCTRMFLQNPGRSPIGYHSALLNVITYTFLHHDQSRSPRFRHEAIACLLYLEHLVPLLVLIFTSCPFFIIWEVPLTNARWFLTSWGTHIFIKHCICIYSSTYSILGLWV